VGQELCAITSLRHHLNINGAAMAQSGLRHYQRML
jgi:hypothetical protein